ncbi:MAG TPA: agmatine deiminase family protein [Bacteroidales bacterium]|nr:agmatine deiminase family protein [Bacteroidales bacterium]
MPALFFPPEWYPQSAVQLTWPHHETDWSEMLDEVLPCFVNIARAVLQRQKLIIVCPNAAEVKSLLGAVNESNLLLFEFPSNDTWARDHGGISLFVDGKPYLCDFTFNAWGMKFPANFDNQLTFSLYGAQAFQPEVVYENCMPFVLEGGSLESDGEGTLLTTSECLLSVNRNEQLSKEEIEAYLMERFGLKRVLWLNSGFLEGDDTDSHIDTLARFCDSKTIAYVQPGIDSKDVHYEELRQMEQELQEFRTLDGEPYHLIGLPMADPVFFEGSRLPATYANFLIINGAVLFPTYGTDKDEIAMKQLQIAFPDREIIGIFCLPLLKQHGSLHCVTMQYPESFV